MQSLQTYAIPPKVRLFALVLVIAGSFFFYAYTFNPGLAFHGAVLDSYSAKMGFGSAGVRIFGGVLAIVICLFAKNRKR